MGGAKKNDSVSFEKLFQRDIFIFKMMGLSSLSNFLTSQKIIKKWWDGTPILFGVMCSCTVMMCQFQTMCVIAHAHPNYAIRLFSVICSGASSAIKSIRLWMYRSELYDLLQNLGMVWESARHKNFLTEKIIKTAQRTRLMMNYYTVLVTFLSTTYIIRPYILIFDYFLHEHSNITFDFSQIVFPSNLPFTIDSFSKYFICVTFQQFVSIAVCIVWVSCDTLFAQITTHVSIQFMILTEYLTKIINDCCSSKNNRQAIRQIRHIVDQYERLFIYCNSMETFFNPIIFFTVLSNAMNMCCRIYRLDTEIATGNWNEFTKNIAVLVTLSVQTVILCSFADTLTESSTQMSRAIYESQWMDCNQKLKVMLLIIMIRARKEFSCTAYGIITLNHKQLTSIANATLSYYMLLKNSS